jgi:hypothetical protein
MNPKALEDYLRRARHEPSFRQHLLENARSVRSFSGWSAVAFAVLTVAQLALAWGNGRNWDTNESKTAALGVLIGMMMFIRFGDRMAMLMSLGDMSNPSPDPTPAPGMPASGQESRPH